MTINEYYTQELQALRISGAEFSEKNPGLSSFLARKGQDPDVERLLEGFAFLTGRLRQYIHEELPEVSHTLAQLLFPNYLRPLPSYSILQYEALSHTDKPVCVPKHEEVTGLHPESAETCTFRTCYETEVLPLDLSEVHYHTHGERSTIELTFQTTSKLPLQKLALDKLRLYIGNHEHVSDNLYLYLRNYVEEIEITLPGEVETVILPASAIHPVGFGEDEHILPQPKNVFSGYLLLQEYFCYRDKFHFFDLTGLESLKRFSKNLLETHQTFTVKFHLGRKLKITQTLSKEHFQLYCTPIINLYDAEAEPIRKGLNEEYEVRASGRDYTHSEIYSIQRVQGWDSRIDKYYKYIPFESFSHNKKNAEYYYIRTKLSADESRTKTFIRFGSAADHIGAFYENDVTVSLDIQITDRDLPSRLHIGDISLSSAHSTVSALSFANITVPSKSYIPPLRGDFLWRIISNMSLNYLALDNIETLRSILETYDFIGVNDMVQKKQTEVLLEGLRSIRYETSDMIYKGLPIRGIISRLSLDPQKFSTLGEAYLLVSVLNEFFALYCSVNTFHKLEVDVDKKAQFIWKPRMGKQALL